MKTNTVKYDILINKKEYDNTRRVLFYDFILDVDNLCLCTSFIGSTTCWLDLNILLKENKINPTIFKYYLEEFILNNKSDINQVFNKAIYDSSSILHKYLIKEEKEDWKKFFKILKLSYEKDFEIKIKRAYYSNLKYLYQLCRLRGFTYLRLLDVAIFLKSKNTLDLLLDNLNLNFHNETKVNILTCTDDMSDYSLNTNKINHLVLETLTIINIL